MASEAVARSIRGRLPVFSQTALRQAEEFSYARNVRTRRGAQDLVYRMFAIVAIELFREAFPDKSAALEWLLSPRRHTLFSELGRIGSPRSGADGALRWNQEDVSPVQVALEVAAAKPSTKAGVAMIRDVRRQLHAA